MDSYSGTYIYHGNIASFGGDNLITFTSQKSEYLYVHFRLVKKAELVLSSSFLSYYVDSKTPEKYDNSNKFGVWDESDPEYTIYYVYAEFFSDVFFNKTIMINEIKLVFTCPR
jgi:hypothetical protein